MLKNYNKKLTQIEYSETRMQSLKIRKNYKS